MATRLNFCLFPSSSYGFKDRLGVLDEALEFVACSIKKKKAQYFVIFNCYSRNLCFSFCIPKLNKSLISINNKKPHLVQTFQSERSNAMSFPAVCTSDWSSSLSQLNYLLLFEDVQIKVLIIWAAVTKQAPLKTVLLSQNVYF